MLERPARPVDAGPAADPLRPGRRVAVRHRLPPGSSPSMTDVVGIVLSVDPAVVVVESARGPVAVDRATIVAARAVPPRPQRRGPAHRAIGVADLEGVMAEGWAAVETERLGEWLLRASSGFTGRGNSLLPHGDPRLPLAAAVDATERWYAARHLPTRVHLDLPADTPRDALLDASALPAVVATDTLGALLLARGYVAEQPTLTMTGPASGIPEPGGADAPVRLDDALTPGWLATYARQRSVLAGVTEQLLTGSPAQVFASTGSDEALTGVARMSVHVGWAGIHAVWVDPTHRRAGLGLAMLSALAQRARELGVSSLVLQVEAGNAVAVSLYERIGFGVHHPYVYCSLPLARGAGDVGPTR